jgi:hypothetical protein
MGYHGGRYEPSGCCPETKRFGSACVVSFGAPGRSNYLSAVLAAVPPGARGPEIRARQEVLFSSWRQLRIEKHGTELVIPVSRDRETKRLDLVDCLGRTHVIEEQRIDLRGPKKTIVVDVYGRARVLSPKDADRVLGTRLRDYLDNGDPSPAGPVAPVTAEAKPKPKG